MQESQPKQSFSPASLVVWHVLLPGSSYLTLRQYSRFFVLYAIMIALLFVAIPYSGILVLVLSSIDVWNLAKSTERPAYSSPKNAVGVLMILGYMVLAIYLTVGGPLPSAVSSVVPCNLRYPGNEAAQRECEFEEQVDQTITRREAIKQEKIVDETCDAWLDNEQLSGGARLDFQTYCYTQKAIETGDPRYCASMKEYDGPQICSTLFAAATGNAQVCLDYVAADYDQSDCLTAVAMKRRDANVCGLVPLGDTAGIEDLDRKVCQNEVEECKSGPPYAYQHQTINCTDPFSLKVSFYGCQYQTGAEKTICEEEFKTLLDLTR